MSRLFTKIFLWFCAAQLLFATALIATLRLAQSEDTWPRWHDLPIDDLESQTTSLITAYEHGSPSHLAAEIRRAASRTHTRIWLLDDTGADLSGAPVPRFIAATLRQKQRPQWELAILVYRILISREVYTSDGRHASLVIAIPRITAPDNAALLPESSTTLALGAALLSILAVCWWLTRYLTRPVLQVQTASRRLATGDFTARAATPALTRRRDELSALALDFDEMASRVEAAVQAQRTLIADISHELGSPLTRVSVALGLARKKADSRLTPELDRIETETARLNHLIQELLDLESLQNDRAPRATVSVDLNALVEDIVADAGFEAAAREIPVLYQPQPGIRIQGVPDLLRQAIENVVRNAVRHTAPSTSVEVTLHQEEETITLTIRDHGPGIPEDELENIFRPFYRVSKSRTRGTGGAGLGLAIARRAIEYHRGQIQASNTTPTGLTVELKLPH